MFCFCRPVLHFFNTTIVHPHSVFLRRYAYCPFEEPEEIGHIFESALEAHLLDSQILVAQQIAGNLQLVGVDCLNECLPYLLAEESAERGAVPCRRRILVVLARNHRAACDAPCWWRRCGELLDKRTLRGVCNHRLLPADCGYRRRQ